MTDIDFDLERSWWNEKASKEERIGPDVLINRALRWREIERRLDGVSSILEVGAATGVFSIPLARRGFNVTHLDFSPAMLEIARENARGIQNITFVEANATDLSEFEDRSFDLVLNMDGAISFSGVRAGEAVRESCRVTKKTLILTVSNRAQMAALCFADSVTETGRILPAVHEMFLHGQWRQEQFPDNALLAKGNTQNRIGPLKAYLPTELRDLLQSAGMSVLRCGGLGSLTAFCDAELITRLSTDKLLLEPFLDLCEQFDTEIMPDGPGTRNRAGLIAVAAPRP
ncbi:MAG: class I SAM-dependent methyltransferase [Candidatus Hydrogenedentes bacterium]|nr:class I SAM-dependent methyltransferase [Candidatus Hydrogenedentota bacterium]